MDRTASTVVVSALVLLVLVGMFLGWRSRKRRQSGLPRPSAVPAEIGTELFSADLFYVATTIGGEPLNRVAVSGLGFRARASVIVAEAGIVLAIAGEPDAFLPKADLMGVERATWTIDRVVETGGLVAISWRLGAAVVDSYLRMVEPTDPSEFIAAINQIVPSGLTQESEKQ